MSNPDYTNRQPSLTQRVNGLESTIVVAIRQVVALEDEIAMLKERLMVLETWLLGKQIDLFAQDRIIITPEDM